MKRSGVHGLTLLLVGGLICPSAEAQSMHPAKSSIAEPTQKSQLAKDYGRLPLSFEINQGQTDPRVKFLSHGAGQTLFLTSNEVVLVLGKPLDQKPNSLGFPNLSASHSLLTPLLRMRLLGANPLADVTGLETLPGTSNYFIGNDPARWRRNVPTYGKVRYSQIYPGIDLVYYGNQRQLEYDFVVAPGADPAQIRLAIRGANKLSIDADGNAVMRWKDGDVRLLKPRLYQEVRGEKIEIAGGYALKGNELRFAVASYDHSQRLVIDPVLFYSTYLGGINSDGASGVAVDSSGNAYVVGTTQFGGFPVTSGVVQPTIHGPQNVFVAKINAAGNALVYSTYLGGSGQDTGFAIAVDSSGSAYVTGATISSDFPITSGAFQTTTKPVSTPGSTVFVTKLSPDGSSLAYSTYLGGSANDLGFTIAVDASGSAYVAGETQSGNFPVYGSSPKVLGGPISCDSMNSGGYDGFITKFSPGGDTVAYSLYLGGSGTDVATGVAVDASGDAYVAGYTTSKDFLVFNICPGPGPGPTSLQPANGGTDNGFIVKVSPDGSTFLGATYLGGSGQDALTSIAVDGSGFVYLAGEGNSGGAGGLDAIGAKLNGSLSSKMYFKYIGGSGFDRATGVAVDSVGNEYLVGQTASTNFPQVSPIQPAFGGGTYDAFVTELDPSGTIVFSTYLGGSGDEGTSIGGAPIAVDASGNIYVAGSTTSTNFPGVTPSSIQPANGGGSDAFIVKLSPSGAASITALVASGNPSVFGQQVSLTVTVSPNSTSSNTPSGSVTINDGSTTLGTVPLASGTAIFNTSTLAIGTHSLTASYGGDSNFSASTSTPLSQVVNQGMTATSVVASPNPGIVGQPVTLTATIAVVAPAVGAPTGTMNFLDGVTSIGTAALSGGQATLTTSSLSAGAHSITVTYAGDANFLGSTSSANSLGIQQTTAITLIVSPSPANVGQPVTLIATVAPSPTGSQTENITFLDGAAVLGIAPLTAGTATFTTSSLAAGGHSLTASYAGDAGLAPSTSGVVSMTVVLPPAVITVNETITVTDTASFPDVFDPEAVKVTDAVWITPLINVGAPVAEYSAGNLGFSGQSGSQTISVSDIGTASLSIASAAISGSSQFAITQIACSNSATSFSTMFPSGGACVLTIGYSASATPANDNGTLTFTDNAALSNLTSLQAGSNYNQAIPVSGSGSTTGPPPPPLAVVPVLDNETITVTDQVSVQVLNATTTSISLNGTAVFGVPVSGTVSVSSLTAAVTGNVALSVDGGTPSTLSLTNGSATFNLGNLSVGPHALAANFPAQGNFLGSSTAIKFTVAQATPTISWKTPAPITYGTPLGSAQLNAIASVPGTFIYSPAAGTLNAGAQTLLVTLTPTDTIDYTTATATVTLLVNPATPTITWVNPPAITYGTALSGKQLNATVSWAGVTVLGTLVYNPPLGAVLSAGSQTLSAAFAPNDKVDYTKVNANVTLVVNQATPTITWVNPAPITLGTPLSSTQLNATASVSGVSLSGTFVYNPPLKAVLGAGTQTLSVTFTPTDTTDYQTVMANVSITVNVSGNLSIQSGQNVTFINGSISGNVMLNGGTLTLIGSTVGGSLTMSSGSLTLGGNSIVNNNVQIQGGSFSIGQASIKGNLHIMNVPAGKIPGVVCGASVSGDLQFQYNAIPGQIGPSSCTGNRVGGNLQITNNTAPLQIFKNAVGGNLQVQGNTGSAQVFQNTVQNLLQCSGNSSPFTGGKNTAAGKQGQCASF